MSIGLVFWIVFLISVLLGFYSHRGSVTTGDWAPFGGGLLLFVLLFLLGWSQYGFIIKG